MESLALFTFCLLSCMMYDMMMWVWSDVVVARTWHENEILFQGRKTMSANNDGMVGICGNRKGQDSQKKILAFHFSAKA